MKSKKGIIIGILIILILVYLYLSIFNNNFNNNMIVNYLVLVIIVILGLYIINLIHNSNKGKKVKSRDKLFNTLVENSDTIYIMINSENNKVMYISDNVENVLGIKKDTQSDDDLVYKILNLPIIKSELNNWDKRSQYVSQMVEYDNPKYNHKVWIKIKILPFKDKNMNYYILEIMDSTKEHNRQHLLISQATDIKSRENQLNQITAKSYDMEMNINLITNKVDLKYFKKDTLYFGEERRVNYNDFLNDILEKYINHNDSELVKNTFSPENLKERFSKYELDSIVIRYRVGNEVKNNIWLESTIFFLSSRQKNLVSILTKNVTLDAESVREQNVLLQNALNDAKLADKAKTNLISTISHDIRTPLTNIMGLSESLLNENMDNSIKDDIRNINLSSNEVLEIIDGLLDASKIEKRLIQKNEKNYSLFKMFNEIENTTKDYIGNKNIEFKLNLDNNLPVILYGDSRRIQSSIIQILNNSVKYTDEGEILLNVRGQKENDKILLSIEIFDTGHGIDENKLNSIINSNDNSGGLGTVKSLMKLLDGKLEIESKVNEFTKVKLSFVQKIVEDNKIREMMNNNKIAEEFSLKGKKVLVVDDNKLNLKVTSKLLSNYDLSVTLLENGEECIDIIKEGNSFDLILLDQMMPGMDGITTLNNLRQIKDFNTPVVVLTADAMTGQRERYLQSGFDDYISKPIDKSELSRILKKFLKNQ